MIVTDDTLGPIPGACEPTAVGYPPVARLPALAPLAIGVAAVLPDLDTCSPDELLDLAAAARAHEDALDVLCNSPRHVRALIDQIERLDLDVTATQDALLCERDAHQATTLELESAHRHVADLDLLLAAARARAHRESTLRRETGRRLLAQTAETQRLQHVIDSLTSAMAAT